MRRLRHGEMEAERRKEWTHSSGSPSLVVHHPRGSSDGTDTQSGTTTAGFHGFNELRSLTPPNLPPLSFSPLSPHLPLFHIVMQQYGQLLAVPVLPAREGRQRMEQCTADKNPSRDTHTQFSVLFLSPWSFPDQADGQEGAEKDAQLAAMPKERR